MITTLGAAAACTASGAARVMSVIKVARIRSRNGLPSEMLFGMAEPLLARMRARTDPTDATPKGLWRDGPRSPRPMGQCSDAPGGDRGGGRQLLLKESTTSR